MPCTVQLLRRSQARWATADDTDATPGAAQWRLWLDPSLREAVLDDGKLSGLDGHRLLVDAQNTCLLARCRTGRSSELREVVGVQQSLQGPLPLALMHQLIPGGDAIAQGAASTTLVRTMAGRCAAIHASCCLCLHPVVPLLTLLGLGCIDLLPVQHSILMISVGHSLAFIFVEALLLLRVLHRNGLATHILQVQRRSRTCTGFGSFGFNDLGSLRDRFLLLLESKQGLLVLLREDLGEAFQGIAPLLKQIVGHLAACQLSML
mmetsp:Transcript_17596/g.29846  ORF Transcript_17596/g.29846 Transcript_17596/m.29846 type:complete len:263 (-) Transcript_17596:36-824(-)